MSDDGFGLPQPQSPSPSPPKGASPERERFEQRLVRRARSAQQAWPKRRTDPGWGALRQGRGGVFGPGGGKPGAGVADTGQLGPGLFGPGAFGTTATLRGAGRGLAGWISAVLCVGAASLALLRGLPGWPWRRIAQGAGLTLASGLAVAAGLVVKGAMQHPPEWFAQRLAERSGHGVYSREGALLGAVFERARTAGGRPVDHASDGHVPLNAEPPPLYTQMLLALEHQGHFDPWRNWCGSDPLAIIKRLATGSGGGSTVANQLAKQLMEPEAARSRFMPRAIQQKLEEIGAACSLHRLLGGPAGVLRAFADAAPVAQVRGTSRGLASGTQVLFGVSPGQSSPAMLAVLGALVKRPLALAPPEAFAQGCDALRSVHGADARAMPRPQRRAKSQCHVLARARVALHKTLPNGPLLAAELARISAWEHTGIQPEDRFAPVPASRLVNVSTRGRALLGDGLLAHVAELADQAQAPAGSALVLSFDAAQQQAFRAALATTLGAVDASVGGREQLCVTMTAQAAPRHCVGLPPGHAQAELVLVLLRLADGGIARLHHSTRGAYDREWQLGSLAKLVVVVAAVRAGYGPDTPVCPRAAQDGGRPLRRETAPQHGFAQCGPAQMITLAEATARSDSLAYYDLARQLGQPALAQAMAMLGLRLNTPTGLGPPSRVGAWLKSSACGGRRPARWAQLRWPASPPAAGPRAIASHCSSVGTRNCQLNLAPASGGGASALAHCAKASASNCVIPVAGSSGWSSCACTQNPGCTGAGFALAWAARSHCWAAGPAACHHGASALS